MREWILLALIAAAVAPLSSAGSLAEVRRVDLEPLFRHSRGCCAGVGSRHLIQSLVVSPDGHYVAALSGTHQKEPCNVVHVVVAPVDGSTGHAFDVVIPGAFHSPDYNADLLRWSPSGRLLAVAVNGVHVVDTTSRKTVPLETEAQPRFPGFLKEDELGLADPVRSSAQPWTWNVKGADFHGTTLCCENTLTGILDAATAVPSRNAIALKFRSTLVVVTDSRISRYESAFPNYSRRIVETDGGRTLCAGSDPGPRNGFHCFGLDAGEPAGHFEGYGGDPLAGASRAPIVVATSGRSRIGLLREDGSYVYHRWNVVNVRTGKRLASGRCLLQRIDARAFPEARGLAYITALSPDGQSLYAAGDGNLIVYAVVP